MLHISTHCTCFCALSEAVPSGHDESRTWTQPFRLSPSVTGSDWVVDCFEGIHIDFQAGELVSPAHKLYIHFNVSHDMIREWIMTCPSTTKNVSRSDMSDSIHEGNIK